MRIVPVTYVFQDDGVDPLYKEIGLEQDADFVEILEDGYLNLDSVIGASENYEMTQVYCSSGHTFIIDLPLQEFYQLWIA